MIDVQGERGFLYDRCVSTRGVIRGRGTSVLLGFLLSFYREVLLVVISFNIPMRLGEISGK